MNYNGYFLSISHKIELIFGSFFSFASFNTQSLIIVLECEVAIIFLFDFVCFKKFKITLIIPKDVKVFPVPGGPLINVIGLK